MKKIALFIVFSVLFPVSTIFAQTPAFKDVTHVSGLAPSTAMVFAQDGRIFVTERGGKVRVIKNGQLLPTPFLTVSVALNGERGLTGITLDPDFKTNGFVYIYYTRSNEPIKNRLSRFTVSKTNPDIADPSSEKILLDDIPSDSGIHNAGALHFGKDGKLYISVGDGGSFRANAQILTNLSGKILRLNSDGTIPKDNPFVGYSLPGVRSEIWAFGFRNPFTFAVEPTSGKMYVNDVGETTWEEINLVERDGNYAWPKCEGPMNTGVGECTETDYKYPIHAYNHNKKGASITGAAFYKGDYYFGDIVLKVIRKMNASNVVSDFISTSELPVDIDVGPDGSLYYLGYGGKVMKIVPQDTPVNGVCAATVVNFCHAGTMRDDADSATHARWSCVGSGTGGVTASCSLPLTTNKLPTAIISTPTEGARYNAGQSISFSGIGTDPEDGTLPASAFSWTVAFHHNTHTHPFLGPITGKTLDSFVIPNTGELADDVWYRIYLSVTDSKGAKSEVYRDIYPNVVDLTFRTEPPGGTVVVDGQPQTTPYMVKSVVGMKRVVSAAAKDFSEWSNGGTREQTITTPANNTVYAAIFRAPRPASVVMQPYYGSGDLATLMQKEVDDRIANSAAIATARLVWYTQGSDTAAWERNPFTILYGSGRAIILNGQSPWNSSAQYLRSGTLISPRHIIFARHFPLSVGTTVVFVTTDNTIIKRKVEKVETSAPNIDIGVALLDADVPESIPFYPIIPRATWQQYLENAGNVDIPIIYLDQEDKIGIRTVKSNAFFSNSIQMTHIKGSGKRADFDEPIVSGDSGNPAFAIVGGQPVLLFTHFDFTFGPNFATHFDLINSMMTKLGGGYQLSTVDLSRFNTSVQKFTLTVTKPTGGNVLAAGGIDCGTTCTAQYNKDTEVSLAANKATGYNFTGWSGDCSGLGLCVVKMDKAKTVTANFTPISTNRPPTANALDIEVTGLVTVINLEGADPDGDPLIFVTGISPIRGTLKKETETRYTYTLTSLPNTAFVDGFNYYSSDGKQTSPAVRVTLRYTPVQYNLLVTKTGLGTVTATNINCGLDCAEKYPANTNVTLTVTPNTGYTFTGWSGECTGMACTVAMTKDRTVTANFTVINTAPTTQNATYTFSGNSTAITLSANDAQNDPLTYTLSTLSTPKGTLAKINETTYSYTLKTPLPTTSFTETFTFTANDGKLTSPAATITIQYTVTAPQKFTLTVSKTGTGTITGTGISCGIDCTEQINAGSVVSLTATPGTGFTFTRWTGECANTNGACSVTMDRARSVNAVFTLTPVPDADGDGILLPIDKCPNTPAHLRGQVNRVGCVRPKQNKFNTKPVVEDDITAVQNVELGINNVGKIKFNAPVSLTRENAVIDLDTNVIIEQDKVEIKSSVVPELNKPATITLYNVDETNPQILKDGVVCTAPQCVINSFENKTLTFTVTGFSVYTIQETPATTTEPEPQQESSRRRRGGGGGGSRTVVVQTNDELIAQLTAQLNLLIAQLNALTVGTVTPSGTLTKNLSIGSRDPEVRILQQLLNKKGIIVPTTGYFGAQTLAAVKKFQAQNGIAQTGSVGPLTRGKLSQ